MNLKKLYKKIFKFKINNDKVIYKWNHELRQLDKKNINIY